MVAIDQRGAVSWGSPGMLNGPSTGKAARWRPAERVNPRARGFRKRRPVRTEARFLLAQIYRLFEDEPQRALIYLAALRRDYPENALFHRYMARTLAAVCRSTNSKRM